MIHHSVTLQFGYFGILHLYLLLNLTINSLYTILKDIYSECKKYWENFTTTRISNNNEENYLGFKKNVVHNKNLVMPSEYVQFNYPLQLANYNALYLMRENELSIQLTKLDTYDGFGR